MASRPSLRQRIKDLSHCKALIFPGMEDFGIVPLEAMACGRPVIAYAAGGTLETVKENISGVFFSQQTPEGFTKALFKQAIARLIDQPIKMRRR